METRIILRDQEPETEGRETESGPPLLPDMDLSVLRKISQTVDQSEGPPGGHCDLKPREAPACSALLEKFCLTRDRKEVKVCAGCWGTQGQQEGEGSQGWISGNISELEHGVRGCRESRVL